MTIPRSIALQLLVIAILLADSAARAQSTASQAGTASVTSYQIDVDASKQWVDTKIDLRAGEKLRLTAKGTINYPPDKKHPDGKTFGPDGLARTFEDLIHEYPVSNAGHGSLVGRLGDDDGAQPFAVGASMDYEAPVAGRLFLGINQSLRDAEGAKGNFQVKIEVINPGLSTAAAMAIGGPPETPVPSITAAILKKIPRRVSDPQGKPGDMVNVLIVGEQEQIVQVFTRAGWVQVDSSVQDAVVNAVIDSLRKKRLSDHADEHALSLRPAAGLWIRSRRAGACGDVAQSSASLEIAVLGGRPPTLVRRGHA